ncbi:hypothetical protein CBP51_02120 [Cellvibrio mixtus]|uniref:Uncharacterized protein n=1 Tax=Cellvibrio mixtus TaxID=39650 RepID=A0A266Q930_9GAMM|nr:hypothetical protein [Cellvibrio mixtus]OZY85859.1 hypothetical protein CBP51_02120 [Cellvibrio mixtus]
MSYWKVVKFVLIAAVVVAYFLKPYSEEMYYVYASLGWAPVIVGFMFFPGVIFISVFVLKVVLRRKLNFKRPTWSSNPLSFDSPENFFHLAGFVLIAGGLSDLLFFYLNAGELCPALFSSVSSGLGILFGIRVLALVYEKQSS